MLEAKVMRNGDDVEIQARLEGCECELKGDLLALVETVAGSIYHEVLETEEERFVFMMEVLQGLGEACANAMTTKPEGEVKKAILRPIKGGKTQ